MPDVVSAGHDFFVKVHTKKLLHRRDGNEWRKDIYSKLVDSAAIAEAIRLLKEDLFIGILDPGSFGYNELFLGIKCGTCYQSSF